jgi:hypothetical protein
MMRTYTFIVGMARIAAITSQKFSISGEYMDIDGNHSLHGLFLDGKGVVCYIGVVYRPLSFTHAFYQRFNATYSYIHVQQTQM